MSLVLWALVGIGVGVYGTIVGAGGGFALVPILLLVFPHDTAGHLTAVSLAAVFVNAVSGSTAYSRQRTADYRTGAVLALATIPGAILGALVVNGIPVRAFDRIMGIALLVVSLWLIVRPAGSFPLLVDAPTAARRRLVDARGNVYEYRFNLGLAALLSLGVGFVSSLLGIGGGIILVPLLTSFFSFPTLVATATSQFVLMITSGTGTVTHVLHRDFGDFVPITVALAVGVAIGGQAGAGLARRISARMIIRLLALALLVVAVRLIALSL